MGTAALEMRGLVDRASNLADEVLPYYKELGTDRLSPDKEAELIFKLMHANELHALLGSGFAPDRDAAVVDVIGLDSHPIAIYESKPDDFKHHPKGKIKLLAQTAEGDWGQVGKTVKGPIEQFGISITKPEAELFSWENINDKILNVIAVSGLPIAGAGIVAKSIEPAVRTAVAKIRGQNASISVALDGIVDKSFLEASPVLSKALLGVTAFAVALGPIASTLSLKDIKSFGKKVNDGFELNQGFSLTPTPDGKPPHVPRWVYLIPGGMVLWGILSACNEATKRPPAVTVLTATPFPTETPRSPVTLTPVPSQSPEIVITPNNGVGGSEFKSGTIQDLQASITLGSFSPVKCVSANIDSSAYKAERAKLGSEANVELLRNELLKKINPDQGQVLESLCLQGSWLLKVLDKDKNLMWSWDLTKNNWADHPNAVLEKGWEFRSIKVRTGYKADFSIDRFGQPWLVELTKDRSPVRYFDTVSGEFVDFNWNLFAENDNLLGRLDWNGVSNVTMVDGKLHVQGLSGGVLAINRSGEIVHTGDFSFGWKSSGSGAGLAFMSEGNKKLDVILNRSGSTGKLGIVYRDSGFSSTPVLNTSFTIPEQFSGGDNEIEVRFRPGASERNVVLIVNGKEIKTITIKDLLRSGKLSLGVTVGADTEMVISDLFIKAPNSGKDNAKWVSSLKPATPAAATAIPAATAGPQFTLVPPTATKSAPSPLLTPFKDTYGNTLIPVSEGPCFNPSMRGVWVRSVNSGTETCFTGSQRNPDLDAAVESWFRAVKAQGFSAAKYAAGLTITRSIDGLINGTGSFHISGSQFGYDELDGRLAALPQGTKLAFSYMRSTGANSPNQMIVYAQLP